jgi:hypothetical protein
MKPVVRPMERTDQDAVCRLLTRTFGGHRHARDWRPVLEWLYFSHPGHGDPRAFVVAEGESVVGHIGTIRSELRQGSTTVTVVQPVNWVADPGRKIGLQSLELMRRAIATGDIAFTIGGSDDTRRIVPKLGFNNQLSIDRYIKVFRPLAFLRNSRSAGQLARNGGKLGVFLAKTAFRHAFPWRRPPRRCTPYQVSDAGARMLAEQPPALRNALNPEFLAWYRDCPAGRVHALRCLSGDGATVGSAMVIVKTCNGERCATLLNVEPCVDDESGWNGLLESVDTFLKDQRVTHVNAIATYRPWRRALEHHGYCRLTKLPLWVYDRSKRLADVAEWHLTAMEGDLGYGFD